MFMQIIAVKEWGFEANENRVVEFLFKEPRETMINMDRVVYIQPIGDGVVQIRMVDHTSFHIEVEYEDFVNNFGKQLREINRH